MTVDQGSSDLRVIDKVLDIRQRSVFEAPAVLLEPVGWQSRQALALHCVEDLRIGVESLRQEARTFVTEPVNDDSATSFEGQQ